MDMGDSLSSSENSFVLVFMVANNRMTRDKLFNYNSEIETVFCMHH